LNFDKATLCKNLNIQSSIFFYIIQIWNINLIDGIFVKKKHTIIIRSPILRQVRNSLRDVLISACSVEQSKIHDEEDRLREHDDYYENEEIQIAAKKLNDQYWEIERPLRASILLCPACFKTDKDMIFNPVRKEWYCIECYAKLKKGFTEEGQPEQFP